MSTATLTSLLDYLYGTLSPNNMRWVGEHLIEQAKKEENERLRPYTMQEIDEMLDEAEAAFEAGEYLTNDEVFHHKEKVSELTRCLTLCEACIDSAEREQARPEVKPIQTRMLPDMPLEEDFPDMDKELYTPEEAYELTMKDIKAVYDKEYEITVFDCFQKRSKTP